VVLDGDRKRLRALLHELGERKRLKRATPMPTHGLQTPPTPWHGSHPGSSGSSDLRTQPNTSTSPAASSHLTLGDGHRLPPKPITPSGTQTNGGFTGGLPVPMGGRTRRPPPTLVKARRVAASTHAGGTSADSTPIHSLRLPSSSRGRRCGRNRMPLAMDHFSPPHSRSRSRSWSPWFPDCRHHFRSGFHYMKDSPMF
jgi:hypothetical protein